MKFVFALALVFMVLAAVSLNGAEARRGLRRNVYRNAEGEVRGGYMYISSGRDTLDGAEGRRRAVDGPEGRRNARRAGRAP